MAANIHYLQKKKKVMRWHVAVVKDPFVLYVSPWQVGTARPYDKGRHIKMRPQGSGAFPTEPPPGTSAGALLRQNPPASGRSFQGGDQERQGPAQQLDTRCHGAGDRGLSSGARRERERGEVADPIEEKLWAGDGPAVGRPMFVHTVVTSWRAWARRACQ
ncbi:unnamed protein product [Boreogadus saida]